MAEWSNAPHLKCGVPKGTVSSNLTPTASTTKYSAIGGQACRPKNHKELKPNISPEKWIPKTKESLKIFSEMRETPRPYRRELPTGLKKHPPQPEEDFGIWPTP